MASSIIGSSKQAANQPRSKAVTSSLRLLGSSVCCESLATGRLSSFSPTAAVPAILARATLRSQKRFREKGLRHDLLTADEEGDRSNVFDIRLLTQRLIDAVRWIDSDPALSSQKLGLFGASTGAAAALAAAADMGDRISAVVSRGGRPDLAGDLLDRIRTPTLLVVGGADREVVRLNKLAYARLKGKKLLVIVPGATHLFPEKGALALVIDHAIQWFARHFDASLREDAWSRERRKNEREVAR
jgi:dienelactone hydrolase